MLTVACVLLPLLLLLPKAWSKRVVQAWLFFGVIVWVHTAALLLRERLHSHGPWKRMVLILLAVALFTALAGFFLKGRTPEKKLSSAALV